MDLKNRHIGFTTLEDLAKSLKKFKKILITMNWQTYIRELLDKNKEYD